MMVLFDLFVAKRIISSWFLDENDSMKSKTYSKYPIEDFIRLIIYIFFISKENIPKSKYNRANLKLIQKNCREVLYSHLCPFLLLTEDNYCKFHIEHN